MLSTIDIRRGMIGHGSVTEIKNGPGLYKAEHSSLRGVYGRNADKAKDYAARHGVGIVYDSVDAMLSDPEIDAVYMPVPPKFHKEYALRCLEAGKIPYIEKPMAMSYAECEEIIRKAAEKGLPAYVAFYRRGLEKSHRIKVMLDSGEIGRIRYVEVKQVMPPEASDYDREHLPWRLIPEISGGGKFLDMAVHVLDILDFFFGKIVETKGMATNRGGLYEVEETKLKGAQLPVVGGNDTKGELTTDPVEIEKTWRVLPIGFWKGSGLSIALDLIAAILSAGFTVSDVGTKCEDEYGVSQVLIAIDPRHFNTPAFTDEIVDRVIADVKSSQPAFGGSEIRYPGERDYLVRQENLSGGIPVVPEIWAEIRAL